MNSKRFLTTLVIFSAGAMLFMMYLNKKNAPAPPPAEEKKTVAAAATQAASPVQVWRPAVAPAENVGSVDPRTLIPFELRVDPFDAGLARLELAEHFETVADKKLADKFRDDPAKYRDAVAKEPTKYHGHYVLLRGVEADKVLNLPYATRLTRVDVLARGGEAATQAATQPASQPASAPAAGGWKVASTTLMDQSRPWELQEATAGKGSRQAATYQLRIGQDQKGLFEVNKTYKVNPKDYTVVMTLEVRNVSDRYGVRVWLDQYGPTGVVPDDPRTDTRQVAYGRTDGQHVQVLAKPLTEAKDAKEGERKFLDEPEAKGPVVWIGFVNKFFGSMMHLAEAKTKSATTPRYFLTAVGGGGARTYLTGAELASIELAPGAAETFTFEIFAGPKKFDLFAKEPYKSLNYDGTVDLSGCWCAWRPLIELMMWLLRLFSGVGNYGVAIIMLVILVRVAVHPLSRKSQLSMMKMKKIQPLMAKLREKYKDDKDTLNREMMRLYKEQGAMPFLGCLPMFLQMPILIALWYSINATVELRHAAFLPWWITDLSAPDALFALPFTIPWVNINTFNLLPILLGVAMYWQMKVNPQAMGGGGTATSPEQEKSQKIMQYMMVLLMPVMFYNFASGLSLYFMASTFIGAAEQAYIRKHIEQQEALQAATMTTVDAPGKGSRTTRPKKSKGPMWFKRG